MRWRARKRRRAAKMAADARRHGRRCSRRHDAAVGIAAAATAAAAAAVAAVAAATGDEPNVGADRANVAHRPHARFSATTIAHRVVAILSGDSFGRRIFVSTAIFESLDHRCVLSHAASVSIRQRWRRWPPRFCVRRTFFGVVAAAVPIDTARARARPPARSLLTHFDWGGRKRARARTTRSAPPSSLFFRARTAFFFFDKKLVATDALDTCWFSTVKRRAPPQFAKMLFIGEPRFVLLLLLGVAIAAQYYNNQQLRRQQQQIDRLQRAPMDGGNGDGVPQSQIGGNRRFASVSRAF